MTMSASEVEKYREGLKNRKGSGGGGSWFTLKSGTAYLRIGKPWRKNGEFWKDVIFHGAFIPGQQGTKVYCAGNFIDKETGKPKKCAVCRRLKQLRSEPRTKFSNALFKLLVPREEYLWNVLQAKLKTSEGKPILKDGKPIVKRYVDSTYKIARFSKMWHLLLVEIFAEDEYRAESVLGVTHPKTGRIIRCVRTGENLKTEYRFKVIGGPSSISKSQEKREALQSTLVDLDKAVKASSSEELQAYVHAMEKRAKKLAKSDEGDDNYDEPTEDDKDDEEEDH